MDPMFRDILSPHCPRQVKLGVPEDAIVQAWVGGQDSGTPPKPACHLQWYQLSQVLGDREELGGGLSGVTGAVGARRGRAVGETEAATQLQGAQTNGALRRVEGLARAGGASSSISPRLPA